MTAPEFTHDQLLEFGRIHDFTDPVSELNKLEMISASVLRRGLPECPHCRVEFQVFPMHGVAWGLGHHHELGCPAVDE